MFTPALCCGWHLPGGFFARCIAQHLGYFISLASQPCPIWAVSLGLYSVLEGPFDGLMSTTFSEGVLKWSVELAIISARAGLPDPPILSAVSAHFAGLLFFWPLLSGGVLGGFSSIVVPFAKGAQKMSEGLLRDCMLCPGKYSP